MWPVPLLTPNASEVAAARVTGISAASRAVGFEGAPTATEQGAEVAGTTTAGGPGVQTLTPAAQLSVASVISADRD